MHTLGVVNVVWVFQFDKWIFVELPLQPCLSCKKKNNLISLKTQPVATFFAGHEAAVINEELRFGKFRLEIRGKISTRRVVQCWNGAWSAQEGFQGLAR